MQKDKISFLLTTFFQDTKCPFEKRRSVSNKTLRRLRQNASTFEVKRLDVSDETLRRLKANA